MADDIEKYRELMKQALDASENHQLRALDELCRAMVPLVPEPTEENGEEAASFLKKLRSRRRHDQIQTIGEAYLKAGYLTSLVWTNYAQALIERGSQVAAAGLMEALLAKSGAGADKIDRPEVLGLLGRAWKDIAYEAANTGRTGVARKALEESYRSYEAALKVDPGNLRLLAWQGGQMVALSRYSHMKDLKAAIPDNEDFAREILEAIGKDVEENGIGDLWLLTGAAEMCVAQGDFAQAAQWYRKVIDSPDPKADSFLLASTHRQLSQVWSIGEHVEGAPIAEMLLKALANDAGGLQLRPDDIRQLQARVGGAAPVRLNAILEAIRYAKSVGMVHDGDRPIATGFVTEAEQIGLKAEYGKVFVTNAHVVGDPPQSIAIRPNEARVTFELAKDNTRYYRVRLLASLPIDRHDCSVLALAPAIPDEIEPLNVGDMPVTMPDEPRAVVIGHPLGQQISFSFLDSRLVGFAPFDGAKPQRLQYRSPTDVGSSGSPVFDRLWNVIGLHRAFEPNSPYFDGRAGTHAANEGISLQSIREAFKER